MPERPSNPREPKASAELSPVKRALAEIRSLRARVEELETACVPKGSVEPIAIVGAGMRFPGSVVDEKSFWQLLADGTDAITEVPRDRWDWRAYFNSNADSPGSIVTRHGGFLEGVDLFDAAFFGVSPREADAMDPQHRLALEVAWEAIENAGYSAAALQGSSTGVFLGIANNDYGRSIMSDLDGMDAYTGSGNSPAMVAGRLSYVLGLHGPSLAIDTSCSSSLVAVHVACAALRAGECETALAGGVSLILSPEPTVALSQAHMMARDGRCKTFDDAADGYVRSEGCGIVVLKQLSRAIADGDRIMAMIRGSAVNHDGRSGGLTAPNGPAQAAVIRKALREADISPAQIGYVETHGTGTALGDPIEVDTLAFVFGDGRPADEPLMLGAVKTNIGHAEAASGIAGLLKAVLALQHRAIPPNLHLERKNSHIAWDKIPVRLPVELSRWKPRGEHSYAGVSSFGFSGTNAHVVLQEAPHRELVANRIDRNWHVLTVSARTPAALENLRAKYASTLRASTTEDLADLCFTANAGRVYFDHRLAVIGESASKLAGALESTPGPSGSPHLFSGSSEDNTSARCCYVFTGQGSQYGGMGRELYESSPVFRAAMERCSAAWKRETGGDLMATLYPAAAENSSAASWTEAATVAQPALYALEVALGELWRSWGVEPAVLLGHSLGEYAAAAAAGIFTVEEGMRLVSARARLMESLTAKGAMRSIQANVERVGKAIAGYEKEVSIAAVNGPESVVISGAAEKVKEIAASLEQEGIKTRALAVTHAFHSPLLEPVLEEFERIAETVEYREPRVRIVSNRTGKSAAAGEMSRARYWREQMRGTIEFDAGLRTALSTGPSAIIEIGPQPHLSALAQRTYAAPEYQFLPSMRRSGNAWEQILQSLANLYVRGHKIDWNGFEKGYRRLRMVLPTYPFERRRYWHTQAGAMHGQSWQSATSAALEQAKFAPMEFRPERLESVRGSLHRLTVAEILRTLREFGAFAKAGDSHSAKSLIAECGISPTHGRLIGRWLHLLSGEGYLERNGDQFVSRAPLPRADMTGAWREAEASLNDDPFLLEYLRNCSKLLNAVLAGKVSPLETLFPGGSSELARNLYEKSGSSRYVNSIAAAAVQAASVARVGNRRVKILELGGGTGGTTSAILPRLPRRGVSYRFTDVSDVFLHRARERFAEYPFVEYGLLDIENAGHLAQNSRLFDIVVAANVVHATKNLPEVLRGLVSLLNSGGTLVLLESTAELAWHEITTGLIEGWQKSEDELRGGSALMSAEAWERALREAGFANVVSVPEPGSAAQELPLRVILACAPEHAAVAATSHGIAAQNFDGTALAYPRSGAMEGIERADAPPAGAMRDVLRDVPASERHGILLGVVLEEVARVLRLPADSAPKKRDRLMELGMDSLMAVELRDRLTFTVGVEQLPATLIFDYPTPDAITAYLLDRMKDAPSPTSNGAPELKTTAKILTMEEVMDLSDEDVAALLRSQLSQ